MTDHSSPQVTDRIPVAAAVRTEDGVIHFMPAPHRHHHTVHNLAVMGGKKIVGTIIEARGEQGFVMSDGTFANRREAADCALTSGRITKLQHPPYLYSEDLW